MRSECYGGSTEYGRVSSGSRECGGDRKGQHHGGTGHKIMVHFVAPCVLAPPAEWNLFLNISKGLSLAEHLLLSVVCYSSPNTNFAIPKLSDFLPKGPSIAKC